MSTHKYIDRICIAAAMVSLLLTALFVNGEAFGVRPASTVMGYETRLFNTASVHTIDIVLDGWDSFLETCENEEYSACSVVIDNEAYKNVGIRAKGNTSLSMVSAMDSDRYSFKLEFDHYESGKTYYGLDKLCLNNVIQDNSYMKDYLVYQLMAAHGVNAPLCSYVYLTVNGEDWGLYLAVEGVEDGFLQRNYGSQHGALYKPDSMSFGGGRGNGQDFHMENFDFEDGQQPDFGRPPEDLPDFQGDPRNGDFTPPGRPGGDSPGGMPGGGMGASDVKLQYTDENPESYANIFSSAKTEITEADQTRLIEALKTLSENGAEAVDTDQALRYFAVHNFVCNGDSYTGSMVHNYYLYEEDGKLSMIPWDYNLAFGTFQGQDAEQAVNDPIDTPLSVTGDGDRPMIDWIFSNEETMALYHQSMYEFLNTTDCTAIIDEAYALIASYVEKDPTKFCTYEEFETGVTALKMFCELRRESVSGQLAGTIPSTREGQSADSAALVDASGLTLSDMGTMERGGAFGGRQPQSSEGEPSKPTGNSGRPSGRPPDEAAAPSETLNRSTYFLLGASLAALLAGLAVTAKYKRRGS